MIFYKVDLWIIFIIKMKQMKLLNVYNKKRNKINFSL